MTPLVCCDQLRYVMGSFERMVIRSSNVTKFPSTALFLSTMGPIRAAETPTARSPIRMVAGAVTRTGGGGAGGGVCTRACEAGVVGDAPGLLRGAPGAFARWLRLRDLVRASLARSARF